VERYKTKKSESVGQALPQLPWKQKTADLKKIWIPFINVSSISVRRVTCYDHFCVFQFFSILAISMAMAAILKKSTLNSATSHGI
jgi:hypothetical protein